MDVKYSALFRLINGHSLGTIPFLLSAMNDREQEKRPADLPVVYRPNAATPNGHYRNNITRTNPLFGRSKSELDIASGQFELNPEGADSNTDPLSALIARSSRSSTAAVPPTPPPLPPKPITVTGIYQTDSGRRESTITPSYDISKSIAESAMDISLLTANANQLRLLITYNQGSKTYVACITFVIMSLVLQMMVAITMIVVSLTKPQRDDPKRQRVKIVTSIGVAIITMINILVASLVVAEQPPNAIVASSGSVVGLLTNVNITDSALGGT
uniref:Ninjurin a n=1 Tax=Anopheles coluzzii TaxID=1518534 RepID=A0A8W7P7S6_ANOCL